MKNEQKALIVVLIIVGLALVHWAVVRRVEAPMAGNESIKIGVIAPLSGGGSIFGNALVNSIKLAQADTKDTKYQYEVVVEDDETNPTKSTSAAQKLTRIDKVKAIITVTSGTGNAVAPIAEAAGVIHVCVCSDSKVATGTYSFTNLVLPEDETALWIKAAQARQLKRIALFAQIHPGIQAVIDALKAQLPGSGIEIVFEERFSPDTRDFRTALGKSKSAKADAYLFIAFPPSLDVLGKEYHELGFQQPLTGIAAFGISKQPELFEGAWYTDGGLANLAFRERFEREFPGSRFNPRTAPYGYDTFTLLVRAFEQGNALANLGEPYTGMAGERTYGSDHRFRSTPMLWILKNGSPELLRN